MHVDRQFLRTTMGGPTRDIGFRRTLVRLKLQQYDGDRQLNDRFQTNSREVEARPPSAATRIVAEFQTNSREVEACLGIAVVGKFLWFQTNSREVEARGRHGPQ